MNERQVLLALLKTNLSTLKALVGMADAFYETARRAKDPDVQKALADLAQRANDVNREVAASLQDAVTKMDELQSGGQE